MEQDGELAAFIRQAISSVWALEVLLLLRRGERVWSEDELVAELRASHTVVRNALVGLSAQEIILRQDEQNWRYAPASPVLARQVEALQAAYRERPVAVINIISRPASVQSLADAFRFRGDK